MLNTHDESRANAVAAARSAIKGRRWDEAVGLLESAMTIPGAAPGVHRLLIRALRSSGRLDKAQAAAERALQLFPANAGLLSQSAHNAVAAKQPEAAVSLLEQLLAAEGSNPKEKTYSRLVDALRRAGRHDEAQARAREAIGRFPQAASLREAPVAAAIAEPVSARADSPDEPQPRKHPYQGLRSNAFWNRAVEGIHPLDITDWYQKKFDISGMAVATAGSCFAQHIGRHLRQNGYRFVDAEPAPSFLKQQSRLEFGYGMYSARFGNIYTARQLLQLLQRAVGEFEPKETVWSRGSGFVDPFRPTIEPEPFEIAAVVETLRTHHLSAVLEMFKAADVFVFTLGLTEAWESTADGAIFPVAPGVSGGTWDPRRYRLKNLDYAEVMGDMEKFVTLARSINPSLRFLLTVSPVPLMATATPNHVVVATVYSKSVLRAVAGHLAATRDYIDYFPSYEIISAPPMRSHFYNPDMRTVSEHGVEHVMRQFFAQHKPVRDARATAVDESGEDPEDVACDEELLRQFGAKAL